MSFATWLMKRFAKWFVGGIKKNWLAILVIILCLGWLMLAIILPYPFNMIIVIAPLSFTISLPIYWWFLDKYEKYKKEEEK